MSSMPILVMENLQTLLQSTHLGHQQGSSTSYQLVYQKHVFCRSGQPWRSSSTGSGISTKTLKVNSLYHKLRSVSLTSVSLKMPRPMLHSCLSTVENQNLRQFLRTNLLHHRPHKNLTYSSEWTSTILMPWKMQRIWTVFSSLLECKALSPG